MAEAPGTKSNLALAQTPPQSPESMPSTSTPLGTVITPPLETDPPFTPASFIQHAISGLDGPKLVSLIRLHGKIRGQRCVILVDSGASTEFISTRFNAKLGLPSRPRKENVGVVLANGQTQAIASQPALKLSTCTYRDTMDFFVTDLSGDIDVILSKDWLSRITLISVGEQMS